MSFHLLRCSVFFFIEWGKHGRRTTRLEMDGTMIHYSQWIYTITWLARNIRCSCVAGVKEWMAKKDNQIGPGFFRIAYNKMIIWCDFCELYRFVFGIRSLGRGRLIYRYHYGYSDHFWTIYGIHFRLRDESLYERVDHGNCVVDIICFFVFKSHQFPLNAIFP